MTDGVVLAVAFALGWIPLFVYRVEVMRDAMPYYSATERRWVRLTPSIFTVHVALSCILVSLSRPAAWRAAAGLLVFAAAIAFWLWARTYLGALRLRRLPIECPRELRRDGPFSLVRNPMYLGYLVAAAAPGIVAPRPLLLLTFSACAVAIAVRATQEEEWLRRQAVVGYAEYSRQVKRLIPFIW